MFTSSLILDESLKSESFLSAPRDGCKPSHNVAARLELFKHILLIKLELEMNYKGHDMSLIRFVVASSIVDGYPDKPTNDDRFIRFEAALKKACGIECRVIGLPSGGTKLAVRFFDAEDFSSKLQFYQDEFVFED